MRNNLYIGLVTAGTESSLVWGNSKEVINKIMRKFIAEDAATPDKTGYCEFHPVIENNKLINLGCSGRWHRWSKETMALVNKSR